MKTRRVLPSLAFALCLAWLLAAFTPAIPEDSHGYKQLFAMILVPLLFLPLAIVSILCSASGHVSWRFSYSLAIVAPIHLLAARTEAPIAILLFLSPLVAVVFFGVQSYRES
jgi:phosphate starvation-inducible membrane PsiE